MALHTQEINKRRTFAIISHPDAGKTTLTEKFLLYGGAINLAGSVKGKATARHAVSDWMEIEKERGISVTSSVLQFEYDGYCINILDTPGHQDFSEDTYRTLMAADSVVMVIDAAKRGKEVKNKVTLYNKGVDKAGNEIFKVAPNCHNTYSLGSNSSIDDMYDMLENEDMLADRVDTFYTDSGVPENKRNIDYPYWEDTLYYIIEENPNIMAEVDKKVRDNFAKAFEQSLGEEVPNEDEEVADE